MFQKNLYFTSLFHIRTSRSQDLDSKFGFGKDIRYGEDTSNKFGSSQDISYSRDLDNKFALNQDISYGHGLSSRLGFGQDIRYSQDLDNRFGYGQGLNSMNHDLTPVRWIESSNARPDTLSYEANPKSKVNKEKY